VTDHTSSEQPEDIDEISVKSVTVTGNNKDDQKNEGRKQHLLITSICVFVKSLFYRGVGSNFELVRQLNIGPSNVPGWAGCTMATMLKMTNFWTGLHH